LANGVHGMPSSNLDKWIFAPHLGLVETFFFGQNNKQQSECHMTPLIA
jgi:hypothetical protein